MAVYENLTDEEAYLVTILQDVSGLDLAEFTWHDPTQPDGCWRAWPFQVPWFRCTDPMQIDQCVAEGSLVLTGRGQVPIEDVRVGDQVMTHRGRWRPVTYTWDRGVQEVVTVKGHGHPGLTVTPDHKFYMNPHGPSGQWKAPEPGDMWVTPWSFEGGSEVPPLPKRTYAPGRPSNMPQSVDDLDFLWLYGLFVAEGSCSSSFGRAGTTNRVTFSVHDDEVEEVEERLRSVGLRFNTNRVGTERCHNIVVNSRPLATWMTTHGGRGARNKHLGPWVFGLHDSQRKAILDGLSFGDGFTRSNGRVEYTTTSKKLAADVKLLASSLGYFVTFTRYEGRESVIGGRVIQGGEGFVVGWYMNGRRNRINTVTPAGTARVYDLEVDEDHSFIVESIAVSNCARAVGKSQSIALRAFIFPFVHPSQEMVITAPEKVHLDAITDKIETQLVSTRITREMLTGGRSTIKHQPFHVNFANGSRIMGRIPQRDGKGVKGCQNAGEMVWTDKGLVVVDDLKVGDLVLTHTNTFKPITAIYEDVNDSYEVVGQSSFPLRVSCDHRFMGASNLAGPKQKRDLGSTFFQDVEFLLEDQFYWATPTEFPVLPIPLPEFRATHRSFDVGGDDFWWLVGRYLADGHLSVHRPEEKSGSVNWCVVPKKASEITDRLDSIGLSAAATRREHSSADILTIHSSPWHHWILEHFGKLADGKRLPTWALGMPESHRRNLLEGYLSGDGHVSQSKNRIECGTASKELAVGLQLLAQSLGYTVNCSQVTPKTTKIMGVALKSSPKVSYRLQLLSTGHPILRDGFLYSKVKSVTPIGKQKIYDIRVADDHSYLSGSIVSHNIHPIWLEMDEASDYPRPGWMEIVETLNRGMEGAVWRAHGVTRGVRDEFYKHTQPGSGWTVHNYVGMNRPNWTDEERQEKIQKYGSKSSPDYRRNVLGAHGDQTNPLFVLHRLMRTVDMDTGSDYNTWEYYYSRITDEMISDNNHDVLSMVSDLPVSHKHEKYFNYWAGMDVGFTSDPSEILVFGEEKTAKKTPTSPDSQLRLLARFHLERVESPEQALLIQHLLAFYKPKVFAMDSTGVGLPLFQVVQKENIKLASLIKGYNFSSKILVDFDDTIDVDEWTGDAVKEAGIQRNVKEYAQDCLRTMVDEARLILPFDKDLIGQFEGGTEQTVPSRDQYGRRRIFSVGDDHALDAARMAALGWKQYAIDELMKKEKNEVIIDTFMTF